ncbi:MAG: VTT domain-containing protein [Legionella sp.]|uniref:bifunctional DedA family/phosphatase PAP2 family protein n=1 Tax=Legionella sp. TaxID=459 RepID=UPI0039E6CC0A
MSLLVDYVQPLTNWLQQNPHWSLLITFLISLAESLAIIGSIVPGSVTMTALGILAGSGIMRVDLTLLAAILGAVAGDSLSYTLGYVYSERLAEMWPFKKYPQWLKYGKDFFALHGGKSVLIGRFIGPLRSIIPVIAGILHMKQWRFLIANVLSAIGWALLYVMPGVVIGAASHELSGESATRLFVLILIILAVIWIISLMIKWLVSKLNSFFKRHLHAIWTRVLKHKSVLGRLCKMLTPKGELNHDITASLALQAMLYLISFIILLILELQGQWISSLNMPTYLFLQSVHTFVLQAFFIFCTQLTSTLTICTLFVICCIWFIHNKHLKAIFYLSGLVICATFFTSLLNQYITSPRPTGILMIMPGSSFPANHLLVATAFYGFLLFYINQIYSLFTNTLRTFVFTILGLSGLGALYLGDYWLTDVLAAYFAGATINLFFCLIYRKTNLASLKVANAAPIACSLFFGVLVASSISTYFNFHTLSYNHTPYHKEFSLNEKVWWNQKKPILPLYRLNRIGKRISLLNIEYSGDLDLLEDYLEQNGWKSHTESFFTNLLTWINNQSNGVKLPLLTQLYENKGPSLFMIYTDKQTNLSLELRIWESNYNLSEFNRPLWIGSMHPNTSSNIKTTTNPKYILNLIDPSNYLFSPKNPFAIKKISVPNTLIKTTTFPTQPYIILIKDKHEATVQ